MRRALIALLVMCGFAVFGASAQSCTVSATAMGFAPYNAHSGLAVDASSVVTTTCTGLLFLGVSYEVRLDGGQEADILARKMRLGVSGNTLGYQIYLNAGRTNVWGNGVQGSVYTGTMLLGLFARTQTRTVYGRIPGGQMVMAGDYTDGPVMTVIY
ncbi:MAG: spore coat U domain-containing protein [Hyphomonas sp.]